MAAAAGDTGGGRWQQSLFLAAAGMRQWSRLRSQPSVHPCGPSHRAGIYRPSSPSLYLRAEFSTTALFPQVSHLKYDSEFRMHLNFPPVRMHQQPSQGGVFTTPPCLAHGSLPASPPSPSSLVPVWQWSSCHLESTFVGEQCLSLRRTHSIPLQTTCPVTPVQGDD